MKKAIIAGGIGLVSFAASFGVFFMLMPKVAPGLVENTRYKLDSLGVLGGGAAVVVSDSARAVDEARSAVEAKDVVITSMEDSLRAVQGKLRTIEEEKGVLIDDVDKLRQQLQALQKKLENLEALNVEAEALSGTLAKLEGDQLGQILKDLDLRILELLYSKSSARNQAKLLEAMPPDRAARFIHTLVRGTPPPAPTTEAEAPAASEPPANRATQP